MISEDILLIMFLNKSKIILLHSKMVPSIAMYHSQFIRHLFIHS